MANVSISIITVLFILLFLLIIPILVGVYVYRDASRRGMNAILWTLVAVLAPSLIGFIIYLVVRSNYAYLVCPNCGTTVKEDFCTCPSCGTTLQASCSNCGYPIESGWTVCPKCSTPIDINVDTVAAPAHRSDKGLKGILIAVLVIPVLIILLVFITFMIFRVDASFLPS